MSPQSLHCVKHTQLLAVTYLIETSINQPTFAAHPHPPGNAMTNQSVRFGPYEINKWVNVILKDWYTLLRHKSLLALCMRHKCLSKFSWDKTVYNPAFMSLQGHFSPNLSHFLCLQKTCCPIWDFPKLCQTRKETYSSHKTFLKFISGALNISPE